MKQRQKIISFDVEGTLATTEYSYAIWYEAIPRLYAIKHDVSNEYAQEVITKEIEKIVLSPKAKYFEVQYWFDKFDLGNAMPVVEKYRNRIRYYPEVPDVLAYFDRTYKLIISSGTARTTLNYLVAEIEHYFCKIFSSTSDYNQLKTPEFYRDICKVLDVNPEEVIHIGDNWQYDILNAQEAGISAFHISRDPKYCRENSLISLQELKGRLHTL